MQLIKKPGFFSLPILFCVAVILLNGCSVLQSKEDTSAEIKTELPASKDKQVDTEGEAKSAPADLPANELTADLLYDLLLAELALQNNNYDLAFEKYFQAAEQTGDPRLIKKATRATLFSKNDAQTNKSVKLWSELQPGNLDVQQIYASSLITQKKDEQALVYMQRVIDLSEDYPAGLKRCVAILDTIPERQRVDDLFAELTRSHMNLPIVHLYASKIAIKFGDYETADRSLDQALALQPDDLETRIVKVELLKKQQRDQQAISLLRDIVADEPDNVELRLELARLLVANKQGKEAFKHIQILAQDDEISPEVLFAIGLLSMEIEELDASKQYLERLHAYRLYAGEAAYFIGQLEAARKNYPEAEQWFKRVQHGQYELEAHLRLALVLAQQGKLDEAVEILDGYETDNPKQRIEILQIKAEVYGQNEKYKTGYDIYTEALNLSPNNHELLYGRAMLAEKFGRIDLLEEDLLTIIDENPKDNQALNDLF